MIRMRTTPHTRFGLGHRRLGYRGLELGIALCCAGAALPARASAPLPYGGLDARYGYAELATLATAAPIALAARIADATPLDGEAAIGIPSGRRRYYVVAQTTALLAGHADLPPAIRYLVDLPTDPARPKARLKLKGVDVLLLAETTARPGEMRLIGPRAQIPATPANEARVRAILAAAVASDAPPAITGIDRAFHVAGSLPGEGETQIFLRTAERRPISLSILRRPGEAPRWAVALSEMVDAAAEPPKPDTLLWFRLACGLPPTLPDAAAAGLAPEDAAIARDDYALVLKGLGPCDRGA